MDLNLSPYADLARIFIREINTSFKDVFELEEEYDYDNIVPGGRSGFITVRGFEPNVDKKAGNEVRGGIQFLLLDLEILLSLGADNPSRVEAEAMTFAEMLNLHHGVPSLKANLSPGLVYDLKTDERFSCSQRQTSKPPHNWVVDITGTATANFTVEIDIFGKHVSK